LNSNIDTLWTKKQIPINNSSTILALKECEIYSKFHIFCVAESSTSNHIFITYEITSRDLNGIPTLITGLGSLPAIGMDTLTSSGYNFRLRSGADGENWININTNDTTIYRISGSSPEFEGELFIQHDLLNLCLEPLNGLFEGSYINVAQGKYSKTQALRSA